MKTTTKLNETEMNIKNQKEKPQTKAEQDNAKQTLQNKVYKYMQNKGK